MRRCPVGAALALLACSAAHGQATAPSFAFEVATIKPADPARPIAFHRSGYHVATTSTSLEWLITWAWDIHPQRLAGKPGWLDEVRFDIVANAPGFDSQSRRVPGQISVLQLMMQTLLRERFKLAVHTEKREQARYLLVLAPGGPKFKVAELHGEIGQNPFSMSGRGRLTGTQVTAEMLAKVLGGQLGRSVEDQTGLTGVFDFKLEWEPDTTVARMDGPTRPSLFTAVQEQLGLKLESHKGPVEVLVIDSVERTPAED